MQFFRDRRTRGRPPHPDVLTPAEWRVLEQVRAGDSNPEIARRLGIALPTVKMHVSNMLAKLDLPDRQALAAWDGQPVEASRRVLARLRSFLLVPFGWLTPKVAGGVAMAALGIPLVGGLIVAMESGRATDPVADTPPPTAMASVTPSLEGTVVETGFGWSYVIDRVDFDEATVTIAYSVEGDTDGLQETGLPTTDNLFLPFPADGASGTVEFDQPAGDEMTIEFGAAARPDESPVTIDLARESDGSWRAENLATAVPSASAVDVRLEVEGYTGIRVSAPVLFTGSGSPGNFATLHDDLGNVYELFHGSGSPNRGFSQWDFVGSIAEDASTLQLGIPGNVSVESGAWTLAGTLG